MDPYKLNPQYRKNLLSSMLVYDFDIIIPIK